MRKDQLKRDVADAKARAELREEVRREAKAHKDGQE